MKNKSITPEQVAELVRPVRSNVPEQDQPILTRGDMRSVRYLVLSTIKVLGEPTIADVSAFVNRLCDVELKPQNVTNTVRRLIDQDRIEKVTGRGTKSDPIRFRITPEGTADFNNASTLFQQLAEFSENLVEEEPKLKVVRGACPSSETECTASDSEYAAGQQEFVM